MVITIIVKVMAWSPISDNQHLLNIFIWAAFSKWKLFDSQQGILKLGVKRYINVPTIIFPILSQNYQQCFQMFPSKCLKFSKWWILYPTFFSHNSAACNPNLGFSCNLHHQSCGKFVKSVANKCIYIYQLHTKSNILELNFPLESMDLGNHPATNYQYVHMTKVQYCCGSPSTNLIPIHHNLQGGYAVTWSSSKNLEVRGFQTFEQLVYI